MQHIPTDREKEVLLETINFYNSTNRGYDEINKMCVYENSNGNHCAVGRCMNDNGIAFGKHLLENSNVSDVTTVNKRSQGGLDVLLREEYRGLSIEFWSLLQGLHDWNSNWDENGLTDIGKEDVLYRFGIKID